MCLISVLTCGVKLCCGVVFSCGVFRFYMRCVEVLCVGAILSLGADNTEVLC